MLGFFKKINLVTFKENQLTWMFVISVDILNAFFLKLFVKCQSLEN